MDFSCYLTSWEIKTSRLFSRYFSPSPADKIISPLADAHLRSTVQDSNQ